MAKNSLDTLRERYEALGSYHAVARDLGVDVRGVARRLRAVESLAGQPVKEIQTVPPTPYEMPAEELLAERTRRWKRKVQHEAERALIPVRVNKEGPIGILHLGDPHCFTEAHEILTNRGWIHQQDLREYDQVATLDDNGFVAYEVPTEIIRRQVTNEPIIVSKSDNVPFEATTKHRFWAQKAVSVGYEDATFYRADEMTNSQFRIPLAATSRKDTDADISDDEIRLIAWILTDSSIEHANGKLKSISLYQSKPEGREHIEGVLERLSIGHSLYVRTREPSVRANGVVFNHNYEAAQYRIGLEETTRLAEKHGLGITRFEIPAVCYELSRRQFDIFLETLVLADGERAAKNTVRIYKSRRFLDQIQILAVEHGYKTRMMNRAQAWSVLSITDQSYGVIKPRYNLTQQTYTGTVWCVRMPSGKFFTRFKGCAFLSGNCDDDGTDIVALQDHVKLVQDTDGLYVANVGDSTNNWVGRLARLYGDQSTSAAEAWILADWLFRACKGKWLYAIGGNHDLWSQNEGDPIKWIAAQADALYQPSECRIELLLPKGPSIIINARHDFAGHSQWNPAHGAMKAAQFGTRDHIMICGHKHVSGYGIVKCPSTGRLSHCIQVASYKVHDRYARERGFRDQHVSPCVVTIIDPEAKTEAGLIQVFHDPLLAARVLKAMRAQA